MLYASYRNKNYEKLVKKQNISGIHEKIAKCENILFKQNKLEKNLSEHVLTKKKVQHYQARHEKLKEPQALGNRISFTY